MLLRLLEILFPIVAIVAAGFFLGRYRGADLTDANRLNLDVFIPALVFVSLAGKPLQLGTLSLLAGGAMLVIAACGLLAWAACRPLRLTPRTLVPPMMFNNSGNLGLPVAFLAWGDSIMPAAITLFIVQTSLHFSVGLKILDPRVGLASLWRVPVIGATVAGLVVGANRIELWPPLLTALRMLGDISIPLMLVGLGTRFSQAHWHDWRLAGTLALLRPAIGFAIAWLVATAVRLPPQQAGLLMVFGALPPAVMNFIFAERYRQEPERVASIVLIGNLAALLVLPVAIALALA
jgi:malate permease and related proteins